MEYSAYTLAMRGGKSSAYKNHIIKNIEIIGQRKLVIIGGGEDYETLNQTIAQLRKKNVRVPEVAFRATITQAEADGNEIKFIDELRGKSNMYYALILAPHSILEIQLAAMSGVMGTSQQIAAALKEQFGYSDRDLCELNEGVSGLSTTMTNMKANSSLNGESKHSGGLEGSTSAQLNSYKDKMKGQRCFVIGTQKNAKLDEINVLMNERTIASNAYCECFSRTPLRPTYFLLTDMAAYLGNGKYIEGMECFINGDVKVFEDKFKKKPTYLNPLGAGLVSGLATFQQMQTAYETAVFLPYYQMIQLALYMGFSEIYLYGMDDIYDHEVDKYGIGRKTEGVPNYPDKVKQVLDKVKAYAEGNNIRILTMGDTAGLSMFDSVKFEEIDFTTSQIFGKI